MVQRVGSDWPRLRPPFRAEHVGSLHRPAALRDARKRLLGGLSVAGTFGAHDNAELHAIEDEHIRAIVQLQEDVGLKTITDGEYRRQIWFSDFLGALGGIELTLRGTSRGASRFQADEREGRSTTEDVENVRVEFHTTDKIRWSQSVNVAPFQFLASVTSAVPKVTIPAPQTFYFHGGRDCVSRNAYPDLAEFWADMGEAYRCEMIVLATAGCAHVQFDDTVYACLCDPKHIERLRAAGDDPHALLTDATRTINTAIAARSPHMRTSLHICRGNRHGHYIADGGYDAIADELFNTLDVDNYYLEYDTPRAGSFEALRFMPAHKTVTLGLISTKRATLEVIDDVCRRIDDAARYVPLDRLAVSPQCGFSGDMMSDVMSVDQMRSKLSLVVAVAEKVWGRT